MQRITVKKLGPVDYFSAEISQYNFFIGEQAGGKSTIAKCIYFFRNYKGVLREALYDVYNTGAYKGNPINKAEQLIYFLRSEMKSQFMEFFGYSWDIDKNLRLKYEFVPGKIWLIVCPGGKKGYMNFWHSRVLSGKLNVLIGEVMNLNRNKYASKDALNLNSKERIRTQSMISGKINEIFGDHEETYYIPAGRSMLALLNPGGLASVRGSLDYITRQFVDIISSIRRYFAGGIGNTAEAMPSKAGVKYKSASRIITDILKADYYSSPDREIIRVARKDAGDFAIALNFVSSGQQECLWLLNLLYVLLLRAERSFVIIEEPEAHMYPARQYKLLKFITYFANETGSNIMITTHSPYCLTALNTLYAAGSSVLMKNVSAKAKVSEILGGNYAVPQDSLNAYKIDAEGIHSLADTEAGELKTEMIDEVSQEILGEYMKVYDLIAELTEGEGDYASQA